MSPDAGETRPERLRELLVRGARARGFHRVATAPLTPPRRFAAYRAWLAQDMHGGMGYMAEDAHIAGRAEPASLLAEARSVAIVALAYPAEDGPGAPDAPDAPDASEADAPPGDEDGVIRGFVARYARGRDYHNVLKERLFALAEELAEAVGAPVAARPCVDSAPVLERDLAESAGLGFTGKNTMLITPGLGSYTVLGELLLAAEVAPTLVQVSENKQRCGSCRACLDACPTNAFPAPFVLDARRCVSYLTIEHEGAIPLALRPGLGTRIFGCDVCQEVCPFNARAPARTPADPELSAAAAPAARGTGPAAAVGPRAAPDLVRLLGLGANQRRRYVDGTAMRRASRERLSRNVCVALGNAGDVRAIPALLGALAERSPVVRAHAAWALGRLGAREELRAALADETEAEVRAEMRAALDALASGGDALADAGGDAHAGAGNGADEDR
ncbi:tRNA epoxyqueuosine(34) reductase QueG [Haliangium ochraceum]|uniref:4Fe-4S ferredoxin-type domain-containing protein n=1 Tax=Haliangium ochraceum (strain DSM 14365 / JCM 11303 / SMP-2) TaxID=502025 RepID=D0LI60_HALO1|nr:tRNA epoxyqueuosine(34) reductase QueG [Haliangium ochraceum]ACY16439.1 domain of unknown function DUF1730 [Haliangium ochraceum DSM 14365]